MERITSAQPPPSLGKQNPLEMAAIPGRGAKRGEDSKDTYKLPHRLIEKKRRDRINECIAQLKDLLPEHLKLSTLGHLEKAVVLELTLKHVKALNSLLEQQQQQILSLQNGMQLEVLQYMASQENVQDLTPTHIFNHLHKVASELPQLPISPQRDTPSPAHKAHEIREKPVAAPARKPEGHTKNCVPVIQRTYPHSSEQSGSDTDTDSGYGGELDKDKRDSNSQRLNYCAKGSELKYGIKEEWDEPHAKRQRLDSSEDESLLGHSGYASLNPHQPPLCMPFYLLPPVTAAAAYLPVLEKCWYPGGMPMLYPGIGGSPPGLSPEKHPLSLVFSPRMASPTTAHPRTCDSPALHQALKQVPLLNLETKD
ncbi:Class E basic helix-loop-helix protein 40 [Bagarius yarrelli]|uniref:Class E basic helix-loop-helix protein 40 n=1 Tax=Bagarius yarrelli TaxID=175774 RepID=A0A556VUW6_BAGYA|nr:Class E basic helix-loop-helix protein 40 [Bagarius yarrelli]